MIVANRFEQGFALTVKTSGSIISARLPEGKNPSGLWGAVLTDLLRTRFLSLSGSFNAYDLISTLFYWLRSSAQHMCIYLAKFMDSFAVFTPPTFLPPHPSHPPPDSVRQTHV